MHGLLNSVPSVLLSLCPFPMQLLCSLIVALLALATTAVGVPKDNRVALTPDTVAPAGLTNIHDFLGNSLVALTGDGPNDVPVVAVSASSDNKTSQQVATNSIFVGTCLLIAEF